MRSRPCGLGAGARSSASASSAGKALRLREKRDEAERLPAGQARDGGHAAFEQRRIAAKFVDQEPAHQRRILRVDHRLGADQARDHAAAVDVADEHDRHVGRAREAHIGDVVRPQVHFRGAAGPLDQHQIGLILEAAETLEHEPHELGLELLIVGRLGGAVDAALHHDLRPDLALRLEQDRIHVHARLRARGAGLQRLGAADLAAIACHRRIVGHVLRLERTHGEAPVREGARQTGHDQRLADVGAGALEHEGARRHGQNSMPACAFTPAAKWCFTSVISVTRSAASINLGLALRPVTTTCRPLRRPASAATTASRGRYS